MYLVSSCLAGINCRYDGKNNLDAKVVRAKKVILQQRSPSCGAGKIYDGTFSGTLIKGNGLTAELLIKNGIEVLTEADLS